MLLLLKNKQGKDIYTSLISIMKSRNIENKSVMSLTTMLAQQKGFVGRLVKDNPYL